MTDKEVLAAIKTAKQELSLAKKVKCTCSGFVLQYEGRCCCDAGKIKSQAKEKLDRLIEDV